MGESLLRTCYLGSEIARTSARGVLCWLARMQRMSVKRIPCLRACVSGVEGALQRRKQECWEDAWESRHAYPGERELSAGSLSLVWD